MQLLIKCNFTLSYILATWSVVVKYCTPTSEGQLCMACLFVNTQRWTIRRSAPLWDKHARAGRQLPSQQNHSLTGGWSSVATGRCSSRWGSEGWWAGLPPLWRSLKASWGIWEGSAWGREEGSAGLDPACPEEAPWGEGSAHLQTQTPPRPLWWRKASSGSHRYSHSVPGETERSWFGLKTETKCSLIVLVALFFLFYCISVSHT